MKGLKYLNSTRKLGITLGGRDVTRTSLSNILSAFSDADYSNCVDIARSVSG